MSEVIETKLVSVPHEEQERLNLLKNVTVTENGVAKCENPISGTVLQLVGVRVSDESEATHVPFTLGESNSVELSVPGDKPSKIGFFLGRDGERDFNSVVRVGNYPGEALVTARSGFTISEVMMGLRGISRTELDEIEWAGQIGLFGALEFNPDRTRGFFSKKHAESPETGVWEDQRIVIVPKTMGDLVETVGPDVNGTAYQILGYETKQTVPYIEQLLSSELPQQYGGHDSFGGGALRGGGAMRDGGTMKSFNSGVTTGFGRRFETRSSIGSITVASLQTAIEVNIVPEA